MDSEVWRPIPQHPDYEVSSLGRARSWRNPGKTPGRSGSPRILKGTRIKHGYITLTIPGTRRRVYLHHLVAELFIGPRPAGCDVAHWDGNPANNAVSNLRYATKAENMADKLRHGTDNRGDHAKFRKLSQAQVDEIRRRYGPYRRYTPGLETQRSLAAEFGVSWQRIGAIIRGETWHNGV